MDDSKWTTPALRSSRHPERSEGSPHFVVVCSLLNGLRMMFLTHGKQSLELFQS
jgi:hypothetical protein